MKYISYVDDTLWDFNLSGEYRNSTTMVREKSKYKMMCLYHFPQCTISKPKMRKNIWILYI